MAFNTEKQWLQQQLVATRELLEVAKDSELMRISLENRIASLEKEISEQEDEPIAGNARICMWFSGGATFGSMGLRGSFMKETLNSIEGMVRSSVISKIRQCEMETHHRIERPKGNFYVTALTNGSFGYEMTYKEEGHIFDDELVVRSIEDVMKVIETTAEEGHDMDKMVEEQPLRLMSYLKDFYTTLKKNNSFLRMESGNTGFELDSMRTNIGYSNICAQDVTEQEASIQGVFLGALLQSGRFEYRDEENSVKTGRISEDIETDAITDIVKQYTNQSCIMKVIRHLSTYFNGRKREVIELVGIEDLSANAQQTQKAPSSD